MKIRLGTRGSELALTQTRMVTAALRAESASWLVEQEIIHTTGDLRPDLKLSGATPGVDKGVFVKELEVALHDRLIDTAVHSLKDVPMDLPEGFSLVAILPRADVREVLVLKKPATLATLSAGALIATSSLRRQRQLLWQRPDLRVTDLRGNVPTRLQRLREREELHGIVLAKAGLDRLQIDLSDFYVQIFSPEEFLPCASQGAVALEVYEPAPDMMAALRTINHEPTWRAASAERAFLRVLGAGCQTPVGLYSSAEGDQLTMTALLFDEDQPEAPPRAGQVTGPSDEPERLAGQLCASLREK
jgi:hydroxymethylbilane synthase